MVELGELEKHAADFARRSTRIVTVSIEGREEAEQTQKEFPHLTVVADNERSLANAVQLIHPHAGPHGEDAAMPTTILLDRQGIVQWLFRPERYIRRLSAEELLAEVDKHLVGS